MGERRERERKEGNPRDGREGGRKKEREEERSEKAYSKLVQGEKMTRIRAEINKIETQNTKDQ